MRGALSGLGLSLPVRRITVNLAPADMQKEGSHFDLPIALGLLVAMEVLAPDDLATYVALGELGLDGALIPVAGVLPAAIGANAHERGLICPAANGAEAAWAGGGEVVAPADLLALINHFKGTVGGRKSLRIRKMPGRRRKMADGQGVGGVSGVWRAGRKSLRIRPGKGRELAGSGDFRGVSGVLKGL